MSAKKWIRLTAIAAAVLVGGMAQAQTDAEYCPKTRAEVRSECVSFMKTHRWEEASSNWVVKDEYKLPEGVMSRAEIRAERDAFFRANRWDEASSKWVPIAGAPRDVAKINRAQMAKETAAFMRTHRWDEASGQYKAK